MKCIKDELIQRYIDGEASLKEINRIEKHISDCIDCTQKIQNQKELAVDIKRHLNSLGNNTMDIPAFLAPIIQKKNTYTNLKISMYAASVACILLLFFSQLPKKTQEKDVMLIYNFENEFDANRPVSQQEMIIQVIDINGNISVFY